MRIIDNLLAYKILSMLVTPFDKSEAYKLGIIDADGKILKKQNQLTTPEEKDAYTYLQRLVFNLKRLLNKLPGGDKYTKNLIAAYFLIKESYQQDNDTNLEKRFNTLLETIDQRNLILVEEEIIVKKFLDEEGEAGVGTLAANNTSGVANPEYKLGTKKVIKRKDNVPTTANS
jgi:hypothetical protein